MRSSRLSLTFAAVALAVMAFAPSAAQAQFSKDLKPLAKNYDKPTAAGARALITDNDDVAVKIENGYIVVPDVARGAYHHTMQFTTPTANRTITWPDLTGAVVISSLATNVQGAANAVSLVSNGIEFEGATADAYETTLTPADPTADRTVTIPDASGTVVVEATLALTPGATVAAAPKNYTVLTLTPGEGETINLTTTGMTAGHRFTIVVTTSGTSSYTLTFGTNFKTTGTLATGTVSAKTFAISFAYDGTNAVETGRTTAM